MRGDGAIRADERLKAKLEAIAAIHANRPPASPSRQVIRHGAMKYAKRLAVNAKRPRGAWREFRGVA